MLHQPLQPLLRVRVHHRDEGEQRRHAAFDQQGDVFDDHLVLGHRGDDLGAPSRHQWVHDTVQRRAVVRVAERLRGQRGAVQCAAGKQDVVTEHVDQPGQPFGARFDDFACDDVTVDHDTAAVRESG